jgi:small subunit ribosomal protein S17
MAEENPENIVEEVENAARGEGEAAAGDEPSVSGGKRSETDEAVGATTPEAAPAAAPAPQTRRDRLEARRDARRPAQRGQVSPEQREEERQARRAETAKQRRAYRAKLKQRRDATKSERSAPVEPVEHGSGRPRVRTGVVTSAKGEKTITVKIDVVRRHRRYHKIMRSTLKLYAHDEANNANEGDTVRVVECRPMSRTKRWRLTEVLERAK